MAQAAPGASELAQTAAPPAATPFRAAPERGNVGNVGNGGGDGEVVEPRPGEGDFDDDDMENSLSLAERARSLRCGTSEAVPWPTTPLPIKQRRERIIDREAEIEQLHYTEEALVVANGADRSTSVRACAIRASVHCAERVVGLSGDQRTGMPDQTTSRKGSDAASSSRTDSSASTPIRGDFPTWVEFDPKAGTLVFA